MKRQEKGCKTGYQTTTYTRYPYANIVCACRSHFVLAIVTGRGPGPDDPYFQPALRQAASRICVTTLVADAGFDSERAHVFTRQEYGIRAIIPTTRGRPTTKPMRGYWRNKMKQRFPKRQYGQRWQVELFFRWLKSYANFGHLISHSRGGVEMHFYVTIIAVLLMYLHTGYRPSKYLFALLGQVAAGAATLDEILPILRERERQRELAHRSAARRLAKNKPQNS